MFGITRPGIEPQFPGPLANTRLIRPMTRLIIMILFYYLLGLFIYNLA